MPRATRRPTPFAHAEVIGLCRRFLKAEEYDMRRDTSIWPRVYALFPDEPFWRQYQLGFKLNSLAYFLTPDGMDKVRTDLSLFHLDMTPKDPYTHLSDAKISEDSQVKQTPKTVSDLFRRGTP